MKIYNIPNNIRTTDPLNFEVNQNREYIKQLNRTIEVLEEKIKMMERTTKQQLEAMNREIKRLKSQK